MNLPQLSPSEWPVMNVVWEQSPIRAKTIFEILQEQGHSHDIDSVKTYLARMMKKGAISSRREGKAYLYSPEVNREAMVEAEIERCWSKVPEPLRSQTVRKFCELGAESLKRDDAQSILSLLRTSA